MKSGFGRRKRVHRKVLETPGSKGRNAVQQADSFLKWWGMHCKEVPRKGNEMLLADISEIARLKRSIKKLKGKKRLKGSEKMLVSMLERMLRAALFDAAANIGRMERNMK